ncbi:MAG: hypothetical protein FWD83_06875 [Promicromonosporaceae bacterium]|nr:hypothetical protein [Promicromonosporaceae bacterium]
MAAVTVSLVFDAEVVDVRFDAAQPLTAAVRVLGERGVVPFSALSVLAFRSALLGRVVSAVRPFVEEGGVDGDVLTAITGSFVVSQDLGVSL